MLARVRALVFLGAAVGCAGGSDTTRDTAGDIGSPTGDGGSTTAASDATTQAATADDAGNCVPGQQIECACPGGAPGAQACLPDGSGYDLCVCPGAEGDGSSSGASAPTTDASGTEGGSTGGGTNDECSACGEAALMGACGMPLQSCVADPACAAMATCTQQCGITQACADDCVMGMMGDPSIALFQALVSCVLEACPSCSGMP